MAANVLKEGCQTYSCGMALEPSLMDHLKERHGTQTIELKSKKAIFLKLNFKEDIGVEANAIITTVPFIIKFEGVHFLLAITRHNSRHYFWFYFVEDEMLSGGRQFHAKLDLLPVSTMGCNKESHPMNIIFPLNTPVEEIVKKPLSMLYFLSDKGLKKNYLRDDGTYQFSFSMKEMERKVIEIPQPLVETLKEENPCKDVLEATQKEGSSTNLEETIPVEELQSSEIEILKSDQITESQTALVEKPERGEEGKTDVQLEEANNSAGSSSSEYSEPTNSTIVLACENLDVEPEKNISDISQTNVETEEETSPCNDGLDTNPMEGNSNNLKEQDLITSEEIQYSKVEEIQNCQTTEIETAKVEQPENVDEGNVDEHVEEIYTSADQQPGLAGISSDESPQRTGIIITEYPGFYLVESDGKIVGIASRDDESFEEEDYDDLENWDFGGNPDNLTALEAQWYESPEENNVDKSTAEIALAQVEYPVKVEVGNADEQPKGSDNSVQEEQHDSTERLSSESLETTPCPNSNTLESDGDILGIAPRDVEPFEENIHGLSNDSMEPNWGFKDNFGDLTAIEALQLYEFQEKNDADKSTAVINLVQVEHPVKVEVGDADEQRQESDNLVEEEEQDSTEKLSSGSLETPPCPNFNSVELQGNVNEIASPHVEVQEDINLSDIELDAIQMEENSGNLDGLIPVEELHHSEREEVKTIEITEVETAAGIEKSENIEEGNSSDQPEETRNSAVEEQPTGSSSSGLLRETKTIVISCPNCNCVVYKMIGSGNLTFNHESIKEGSAQTDISAAPKETLQEEKLTFGRYMKGPGMGNDAPPLTEYELLQRRMWKQVHPY